MANDYKEVFMKSDQTPVRVGITIGDTNGIGAEIIIKAFRHPDILVNCTPIIYGSSRIISHYKKAINDELFVYQGINDASEWHENKVNIISCWSEAPEVNPGKVNINGGKHAFLALERATQDLAAGKIDVLVTAPISKETIQMAGFQFPGHTEYLATLSGKEEALMMMVSGNLRVALTTSHIALKDVSKEIKKEKIVKKIRELDKSLRNDFGIIRPKIAVLGLNPHAGENGKMGDEEQKSIIPAIQQVSSEKILTFGPYSADGFFGSKQYVHFDAVLAMYHDQGLTAFKSIAFNDGVNFTAGLPIVRTSPDHGTAFDIAGKGIADEQSMRSAIYLAIDVFRTRKFVKSIARDKIK